jgi:replicative DNA helicase
VFRHGKCKGVRKDSIRKTALRNLIKTAGDIMEKGYEDKVGSRRHNRLCEKGSLKCSKQAEKRNDAIREILMKNLDEIDERSRWKAVDHGSHKRTYRPG